LTEPKKEELPEVKKEGLKEGVLYGIGCGIGGSIFILLGTAISAAGPGVLISLLLGGVLIFLTALNYSELETSLPISGGAYNFGREGLRGFAFIIGFFLWIANIITCVFSALALTIVIEAIFLLFFTITFPPNSLIILSILGICFITYLYSRTQRFAAKNLIYLTMILISIFGFFFIAGVFLAPYTNSAHYNPDYLSSNINTFGVIQMFALLFICFTSTTSNLAYFNVDLKNPSKNIPKVNILAILFTLIIYLAITYVVLINIGNDPSGISGSYILLAVVMMNILGPAGFILMCIAAIISTLIAMNAAIGSATSVFQALSRDNYFPKRFMKENKGVPIYALLITSSIAVILTIFISIELAAEMAVTIYFFGLGTVNLAAIYLRNKRKELDRPFKAPFFPYLPLIVSIVCFILAFTLSTNAIIIGLIVFIFAISYFILTIADRHSIVITLAGIKSFMIIFTGFMVWVVANFSVIKSPITGLDILFQEIFLRILIYISIFAIITVFLDIISLREIVNYFVKLTDTQSVAIQIGGGKIIELDKKKSNRIHTANNVIAITEILSSIFIILIFLLIYSQIIIISKINIDSIKLPPPVGQILFVAGMLTLGICLYLSGVILLYINREQKKLGL